MSHAYWPLTACELLDGYAEGSFSPVEVLAECLERIAELNPLLSAFLSVNDEDARRSAAAAERAWHSCDEDRPALCGVPVSVKDTLEMAGLPTTYGSLAFRDNFQPDCEIVRRLRKAGAVIIGKTNTPEFALLSAVRNRLGSPGRNPWDLTRSCGGSSGGAAAAVAVGLGPLAVGTDSGGSIRLPAAYNGVFGMKPTYQRIPSVQQWRAAPGRSHNGPLARTVRDGALLLQVLAGFDARDPDSALPSCSGWPELGPAPPQTTRVAVSSGPRGVADPEVARVLADAANLLGCMGCAVNSADPPWPSEDDELQPGVWAYSGDHVAAAESVAPGFWDRHGEDLCDYALPVYEAGRRALAWHYRRRLLEDQHYRQQLALWFQDYDFLLTPAAGHAPRLDGEGRCAPDPFSRLLASFNIGRNPAAVIPVAVAMSGLPLAVQIVGRIGDDLGVLRMAAALEAARPLSVARSLRWSPAGRVPSAMESVP